MKKVIFCVLLITVGCVGSMCAADEISGKADKVEADFGVIMVSGIKVKCDNAQVEDEMNLGADLFSVEPGDYLDIKGSFTGPGEMTASNIEIESGGEGAIDGTAVQVDQARRQIVISGVTVTVLPKARIEGYEGVPATLEQIPPGAYVECEGKWSGDRAFDAYSIELD